MSEQQSEIPPAAFLRVLEEISTLLRENNAIHKENNEILKADHAVITDMAENIRKIKSNTNSR